MHMGRIIIYIAVGLSVLIGALLVASQIIRPPDLHDFESRDLYQTSAAQAYSGDEGLLLDLEFDQILGDDLAEFPGVGCSCLSKFSAPDSALCVVPLS